MRNRFFFVFSLLVLLTVAIRAQAQDGSNPRTYPVQILAETFGYEQDDVDVNLETIFQGCAQRDCIRSVDAPVFNPVDSVDYLSDDDLLLSLAYRKRLRAYPTRFLDRHEIVNDEFDGVPVVVTYCPLCGSGLAFLRTLDGQTVEFGVSGLLHNNDLIMYDRASNSLWQQITGTAFAGPKRGAILQGLPVTMSEWGDWKTAHPEAEVLDPPEKGIQYFPNPYGNYAQSDRLMFPVKLQDARLHRKRVIYGIKVGQQAIAVDAQWLQSQGNWAYELDGKQLLLTIALDGGARATLDGAPLAAHRMFWFAWYSFNPHTALIGGD